VPTVSAFIPNCRVTILDTAIVQDGNGDDMPDGVPAAEHLPAFWAQKDQRTFDPVSGRWSVIKGYQVKFRPGTVVTESQRIRREPDGPTAQVNRVTEESVLALRGDVVVRAVAITR
jgi:hypothetical protein